MAKAYIKALATCTTKEEAKEKAGYAKTTNSTTIERTRTFKQLVAKLLPNEEHIIKPLKEAQKATKTIFYEGKAIPTEVPDFDARLKATDMVIKIIGLNREENHVNAIVPIQIVVHKTREADQIQINGNNINSETN